MRQAGGRVGGLWPRVGPAPTCATGAACLRVHLPGEYVARDQVRVVGLVPAGVLARRLQDGLGVLGLVAHVVGTDEQRRVNREGGPLRVRDVLEPLVVAERARDLRVAPRPAALGLRKGLLALALSCAFRGAARPDHSVLRTSQHTAGAEPLARDHAVVVGVGVRRTRLLQLPLLRAFLRASHLCRCLPGWCLPGSSPNCGEEISHTWERKW